MFTDPASRIMPRATSGFDPAYNAQTAVDETVEIIVATELISNALDVYELPTIAMHDVLVQRISHPSSGARRLP